MATPITCMEYPGVPATVQLELPTCPMSQPSRVLRHFPHLYLGPRPPTPHLLKDYRNLQVLLTCQLTPSAPSGFLSCSLTWCVPSLFSGVCNLSLSHTPDSKFPAGKNTAGFISAVFVACGHTVLSKSGNALKQQQIIKGPGGRD